jgi:hypothetical protein
MYIQNINEEISKSTTKPVVAYVEKIRFRRFPHSKSEEMI